MDVLDHREAVSAVIHGLALIALIPASLVLLRKVGKPGPRWWAVAAYALGLVACFTASTICHGLVACRTPSQLATKFDHMGIYLLIAGTYTPIVATLLPASHRRATLIVVWSAAALGVVLNLAKGPMPAPIATTFYLVMGWGGIWCYAGMRPLLTKRQLVPVPLGGLLYSVGAAFHVARGPILWPGVFGAHELFHVFVVAGAATHFGFIRRYVGTQDVVDDMPTQRLRPQLLAISTRRAGSRMRVTFAFAKVASGGAASGSPASRRSPSATPPPRQ